MLIHVGFGFNPNLRHFSFWIFCTYVAHYELVMKNKYCWQKRHLGQVEPKTNTIQRAQKQPLPFSQQTPISILLKVSHNHLGIISTFNDDSTSLWTIHILSRTAPGCVTRHARHASVTHFRPISGNIVEVTLVTSPKRVYNSHAKETYFP